MKYTKFIPAAALALTIVSCSDDKEPGHDVPDMSGKEVNFSLSAPKDSRTYYGQASWGVDATEADIFWGDPFKGTDEEVIIYGQYSGRNVGHYTVSGYGTPDQTTSTGQNIATRLTKKGEMGVQWGAQPAEGESTNVTFLSVYPAFNGQYMNQGDPTNGVIQTQLIPLQSPVAYSVATSELQPSSKPSAPRTIDAYPDMRGAIMVAKNEVAYGAESVSLDYKVITNVLDLTINGPTYELINGLSNPSVDIYNVKINSRSGSPIAGVFNYNASTGQMGEVVNGTNTITLQFGKKSESGSSIVYPRLYNYNNSGNSDGVDKLRVRAFLLPGVEASDLDIYIETSFGYYQLNATNLSNLEFTPGQIHRLKFPLFDIKGRHDFDYSRWMEQIDPTIYATELSIPGSWNSFQLVSGGTNAGTVSNKTEGYQVTDYLDQYAKGVRAFVLRVSAFTDNNKHTQSSTGTDIRVQTGWGYAYDSFGYTLNDVLNQLGAKIAGTKEFVVLILRGPGTPPYVTFENVKKILDANTYVYKNQITPETTVGDLAGKIVVKSNVQKRIDKDHPNGYYAGTVPAAGSNFPSMFSEWATGTNATTKTVPLDWGAWTEGNEGTEDIAGNTGLRWCFTECDNIVLTGESTVHENVSTVSQREAAVDAFIAKSLAEYNRKEHDTWMYLVIGGNIANDVTSTKYAATNYAAQVATALNTYTYQKLATDREPCPMGIVMMNFASSTNADYNSANLIRTIINNNNMFIMNKKTPTPTDTSLDNGGEAIYPSGKRR